MMRGGPDGRLSCLQWRSRFSRTADGTRRGGDSRQGSRFHAAVRLGEAHLPGSFHVKHQSGRSRRVFHVKHGEASWYRRQAEGRCFGIR